MIFTAFCRGAKELNGFEFVVGLTIISYANFRNKLKLLFRMFDFDQTGSLTIDEALLFFKSIIIGYCRMVGQDLPSAQSIREAAKITFLRADSHPDNYIEFKE